MLDLKSKLLAAGLVTKEQVEKAEKGNVKRVKGEKRPPRDEKSFEEKSRLRHVEELKKLIKTEQYDLIRKWVTRNRLDKKISVAPDSSEKFFFQCADGSVSWLTLEKSVCQQISEGSAGITAFMSHHGLTHCVLPRDIIEDIAQVFPDWIRVLKDSLKASENDLEDPPEASKQKV